MDQSNFEDIEVDLRLTQMDTGLMITDLFTNSSYIWRTPSTCKAWQEALGMETQEKGLSLSHSGTEEASQRMDDTNKQLTIT